MTKRVNHYRFTSLFFAMVKMTIHDGQNDDPNMRQNDELTNKEIKENKNVSSQKNSLSVGAEAVNDQARDNSRPEGKSEKGQEQQEIKEPTSESMAEGSPAAPAETPKPAPVKSLRAYKAAIRNSGEPLPEVYGYKAKPASQCANPKTNKSAHASKSSTQKFGSDTSSTYSPVSPSIKNSEPKTQKKFDPNNYGGGSRVPSVEATNAYLEEKRRQRKDKDFGGPLEFEPEQAKAWYYSMKPELRISNLPRQLVEKFGFPEDLTTPVIPCNFTNKGDDSNNEK